MKHHKMKYIVALLTVELKKTRENNENVAIKYEFTKFINFVFRK